MNDRVEINIFHFTAWAGEAFDPDMDVRGSKKEFGFFTWRTPEQERPKGFDAIRLYATFDELLDLKIFAMNIKEFFPSTWDVRQEECARIAASLVAKIGHAIVATKPGQPLLYAHSERYAELLAVPRRAVQY